MHDFAEYETLFSQANTLINKVIRLCSAETSCAEQIEEVYLFYEHISL